MGRPSKKGLEYFSLDCKMDDEVNLIIADHGMLGYGILISMYQSIYGVKGYYREWNTKDHKLFSRLVGLEESVVTQIISECIDWGIFNKVQFDKNNILTSRRIQEHYATATYKRTGVEMSKKHLLIDISDKKHIRCIVSDDGNKPTTDVSGVKSTQSKVQYSKVDSILSNTGDSDEPKPPKNDYKSVYDYYISLNLVNHRAYKDEMTKAMKKAMKELNCDTEHLKTLLERHKIKVEISLGTDYPVKARPITEFFGQKKYDSTSLICSEYDDDTWKEPTREMFMNKNNNQPVKQVNEKIHNFDERTNTVPTQDMLDMKKEIK